MIDISASVVANGSLKILRKAVEFLHQFNDALVGVLGPFQSSVDFVDIGLMVFGVVNLGTEAVEDPDQIASQIRSVLHHAGPEKVQVAPDCGMKFLSRDAARSKLAAMVAGAKIVRAELADKSGEN